MPLGATIARSDLMNWEPGTHASTFGGNPVSCAAGLATLRVVQDSLPNVRKMGPRLVSGLKVLAERYDCIGDIRGRGLMVGVELVMDPDSRTPDTRLADRILTECFKRGLLILSCGKSTVRFMPPLIVTASQVDEALKIFEEVVSTG